MADLPKTDFEAWRADVERAIRECYPDRAHAMLLELDRATRSYRKTRWQERRDRAELELEMRLERERVDTRVVEGAYRRAMRELARAVAKPAKKKPRLPRGPRR